MYHKTREINDLCYNVWTTEEINCKFEPTIDILHACEVNKVNIIKNGLTIVDNNTKYGRSMCHVAHSKRAGVSTEEDDINDIGVIKDNEYLAEKYDWDLWHRIDTIKRSREQFTKRDQLKACMEQRF